MSAANVAEDNGGTKNAETLRTILESKKYKSALGPEKLDLKKVNEMTSWIKESYPDALVPNCKQLSM